MKKIINKITNENCQYLKRYISHQPTRTLSGYKLLSFVEFESDPINLKLIFSVTFSCLKDKYEKLEAAINVIRTLNTVKD